MAFQNTEVNVGPDKIHADYQKSEKKRVLIIDDNVDVANTLRTWLSIKGHLASTAYNAKEGLEEVKKVKPEYIFIDICLPDVNGYVLAKELRKLVGIDATLVALTGYAVPNETPAPFDYYMPKPITAKKLIAIGLLQETST